ncbi:PilZ domain-containing protein [Microvirga subterranea]|uniref:PilZ domain-containing protein n=1 Tax=Microvirga subterranea TaxID=186651 RepID=A0A370HB78_9HYPH|nr:PilZ domain-containing protein [Microvirga subterranea]RDI53619.1 PilZ domain-containing protein [Microvirga subterranea]
MRNRRFSRRIPSILEGRIRLGPQGSPIACTIRDLSVTGARIWLPDAITFPDEFQLEIPMLEQAVSARAVWSEANQHGLMFLEALRVPTGREEDDLLEMLRTLGQKTGRDGSR